MHQSSGDPALRRALVLLGGIVALDLPTYIPLEKAAKQFNVTVDTLRQNIEEGTIRAAKTPAGVVLVASEDMNATMPIDTSLKGKPIRVTEAAEKYDIDHSNLSRWSQSGYIRIIRRGPKLLVLDDGGPARPRRGVEVRLRIG